MPAGSDLHVVFGTGPLGLAVLRALAARGARHRAVSFSGRAPVPVATQLVAADVSDPAAARDAADGAAVVYHCAKPTVESPEQQVPLMRGIIGGAMGKKLVFGDNMYAYGPADPPVTEDSSYAANGAQGRIRAEIAGLLMEAHDRGWVKATIARGSDIFGPYVLNSHAGKRVFVNALAGEPAEVFGNPDLPHTYTFIDDFGKAMVILGEREEALGHAWHVPSPPTVTVREFVGMVYEESGHEPRIRAATKLPIGLSSRLSPTMRAIRERLYQVDRPWVVDHTKFATEFGDLATPLREAIRRTLGWFRARGPAGQARARATPTRG